MSLPILGVIPARYGSTRFPGKPLIDIRGKSMIQRVYEQAQKSQLLQRVVVATDDKRIYDHVRAFGGEVMMTPSEVPSGTERVAIVSAQFPTYPFCINIQGDEPYIDPEQIDLLGRTLLAEEGKAIATLVKPITHAELLGDPKFVKVVLRQDMRAMYFSRFAIPFNRDIPQLADWLAACPYYKHIGIYGFPRATLLRIPKLAPIPAETAESLEQLRWLGHGIPIAVAITEIENFAIDTPQDLKRLQKLKEN